MNLRGHIKVTTAKTESSVTVTSAVSLNDQQKDTVKQSIISVVKTSEIVFNVDASIIGGLIFQIGDQLIDTSIVKRLDAFKDHIKNNVSL